MSSSLIEKKDNLPRAARRTTDTTFDRIWKFYFLSEVEVELSEKEEEIRQRWEFAWNQLSRFTIRHRVVKKLMEEFEVKRSTAFEDIRNCEFLFGDPTQQNKAAKKAIVSNALERAMKKCIKTDNWKAFEKLLLRYRQFNDLDKEEDDKLIEYLKKKKPAIIVFVTDADALKKQADELMQDVEDIDHEDVTEEPHEQPEGSDEEE